MLAGVASYGIQPSVEQNFLNHPTGRRDPTTNELHSTFSDIRHGCTKNEVPSTDNWNSLQRVSEAPSGRASFEKIGGDNVQRGRSESAFDLRIRRRDQFAWTTLILQHIKSGQARQALRIYEDMRESGVKPSSHTLVAALKACSSLHDLPCAKQIHAEVIKSGCKSNVLVSNVLLNVYVKCGNLLDARLVFEKMLKRDVVSWNTIILGYAHVGQCEEALQLYARMKLDNVVPSDRTFVAALKGCSSLVTLEAGCNGDVEHAKKWCLEQVRIIHADIVKSGLESAIFVASTLVDVFAKCGSLVDARRVFDRMPSRNVVSWTAMILGYAQMEESAEALQLYAMMQQEGEAPNERTFVAALKACSSLAASEKGNEADRELSKQRTLQQVRVIHEQIVNRGLGCETFVGTTLLDIYAKCGSLVDARCVFEKLLHRDVVSWNAMILGYAQMRDGKEAFQLYARMHQEKVVPDARTFVAVLKACSSLVGFGVGILESSTFTQQVRAIHLDIRKAGCESDLFVGTMLVNLYTKCGSMVDAREVFENMPHRDVVSWNAMILGYAEMEKGKEAMQLYASMLLAKVAPNDQTFYAALKACSSLIALHEESRFDRELGGKRFCLDQVRAVHSDIVKTGYELDLLMGTTLIDLYAKCRSLMDARQVFEQLPRHDVVSWTAMILGCVQMAEGAMALQLFEAMHQEGVVPDAQAFVGALKACGSVAGLERGKKIHGEILKTSLGPADLFVASSLIDMYGKCGSMADAQQVFDALLTRDIVTWSALIAGYACQGDSEIVFDLFQRLLQDGMQPDGVTFLSILTVCSHDGLVDKGQKYFDLMSGAYGITPTIDHYACMVDLLGRAGHLDKAMVMAKSCKPNGVVWRCLLAACRKWRNVELGRQAFEYALLLDRNDEAAYVLMSSIYAAAHMLEDAKDIHAQRVEAGAWKKPGQSWWTDLGGNVHAFGVGN